MGDDRGETLFVFNIELSLGVGDSAFFRCAKSRKPAMRKQVLTEITCAKGSYSVRYASDGVKLTRLPQAA